MKRHPALIPLTHDHHHALAAARRLGLASRSQDPARLQEGARIFLDFFERETVPHFREEEEVVFPVLLEHSEEPREELVEALVQHVRIHALIARLRAALEGGTIASRDAAPLAELLQAHIHLEERRLFPLIEQSVGVDALDRIGLVPRRRDAGPHP